MEKTWYINLNSKEGDGPVAFARLLVDLLRTHVRRGPITKIELGPESEANFQATIVVDEHA